MMIDYKEKEIEDLITRDLSEKSRILKKYRYIVIDLYDNISHWFPILMYREPNLKFKIVNMPLCSWSVNVDFSNSDTILINQRRHKSDELSEDDMYQCNSLINFIKSNEIKTNYKVERIFDFSNEEETAYIYDMVERMLSVFDKDNIKKYAELICSRCVLGYQKKQYYFTYKDIKYENSLYLLFKYNPDITLVYLMLFFINNMGYFEMLVALFYFKKYAGYSTMVSEESVLDYIDNKIEREDIILEINEFKNYLYSQYKSYIVYVRTECNRSERKIVELQKRIFESGDKELIDRYSKMDDIYDYREDILYKRFYHYKSIEESVLKLFDEKVISLHHYDYRRVKVYDNVEHWFPILTYSEPKLKLNVVDVPLCSWAVNVDFSKSDTILINQSKHKSSSELSEDETSYCVNLINYINCNKIENFEVERLFDFSNEDENAYIYDIVEKMLSVFDKGNINKYADLMFSRNGFSYLKNRKSLFDFFKYNPDISLAFLMLLFINKLGYFEMLVALFYFKKYAGYSTMISEKSVLEYIDNKIETDDIKTEIDNFREYLYNLYMDYIDRCFDNDREIYNLMPGVFGNHKFDEISNNYFKHMDDFKKFKMS